MKPYTIKVKHTRFLNKADVAKLSLFNIKSRIHNHIYDEHTAHVPTELELTDDQLNNLFNSFKCTIDNDKIIVDMEK